MKRFGRRLGVMLLVLVLICATVGVAALLGGFGDDGLMARLLLKPGHIIVERRPESDLDANLRYFSEKYDAILARLDEERDTMASVRGTPFRRVGRLYVEYIHKQQDTVRTMEQVLASPDEWDRPAVK